jgi:phospholipase/carboxylesterase
MSDLLDRPHVFLPGSGPTPLLLLHGTGGDEHDLLALREHLAPDSPTLSVRGAVLEHGMPRFFARLREGVFDEADLVRRAADLAAFLTAAEQRYDVEPGSWTAVGFSNGANIASGMLLTVPGALRAAVLLGAMVPFHEPPAADLGGRRVLISNGAADPMATASQTETLTVQLRAAGGDVTLLGHPGGHAIDARLLPQVAAWVGGAPA